jgi:hypothetical protein
MIQGGSVLDWLGLVMRVRRSVLMIIGGVEWGPVGTLLGHFDSFRGRRIRLTFEAIEPWCRRGETEGEGTALSVRIGVEKWEEVRHGAALGLISVVTDGRQCRDVDPVQWRWAGVPRSRAFDRMDLMPSRTERSIVTLDDRDFHRLLNPPLNQPT